MSLKPIEPGRYPGGLVSALPYLLLDSEVGVDTMHVNYTGGDEQTDDAVEYWHNQRAGLTDGVDCPRLMHNTLQEVVGGELEYVHAANVRPVADATVGATVIEFKKTITSGYNRAELNDDGWTGNFDTAFGTVYPSFAVHLVVNQGTADTFILAGLNTGGSQGSTTNGSISVASDGELRVRTATEYVYPGVTLTLGEWTSLVIVHDADSGTITGYANGVAAASPGTITGNPPSLDGRATAGQLSAMGDGEWFRLAKFEIYVGLLREHQVRSLWESDRARYGLSV